MKDSRWFVNLTFTAVKRNLLKLSSLNRDLTDKISRTPDNKDNPSFKIQKNASNLADYKF